MHFIMNFFLISQTFVIKQNTEPNRTEQSAVNGNIGRGERNNEAIILIMRHRTIFLFGVMFVVVAVS